MKKKRTERDVKVSSDEEDETPPVRVQPQVQPQVAIRKEDDDHEATRVTREENCKRTIIRQSPVSVNVSF